MLEQLINHFFRYEFVYVFIFCAILFLLLAAIVKKQILKITSIFLFSIFFSIFASEFFLSLKMRPLNDQSQKIFTMYFFDESIDYSKLERKKHLRYDVNGQQFHFLDTDFIKKDKDNRIFVYNAYETKYQSAFRYTESNLKDGIYYIFLGCSFMYGLGLNDNQTLPYFFSKILDYKFGVLNCGIPASGSNSALNILESGIFKRMVKKVNKIKHFIYLGMAAHPLRNFTNEFSDESSDNYVYTNNKFIKVCQPFSFFTDTFARSYIFRKIFLNLIENKNRDFYEDYFINSLLKMNDIIEKKYDSKFTVLLWMGEELKFETEFIEKLKSTNLDILVLPEFDRSYLIHNDEHPNEKANREIAKILLKHFEEQDKKNEK